MKCFFCDKAAPKFSLFRINKKGVPGVWACREHTSHTDSRIDPFVRELAGLFDPKTGKI